MYFALQIALHSALQTKARTMQYVKKRGRKFHYVRRVPKDIQHIDIRDLIQISLKTDSLSIAHQRAAILDKHIMEYWQELTASPHQAQEKFAQAVKIARLQGFGYSTAQQVAAAPIKDVASRVLAAKQSHDLLHSQALLGGTDKPSLSLSQTLDTFWGLSKDRLLGKSPDQIRKWRNPRIKAFNNLIKVLGDKPFDELNRDDVLDFKDWWLTRINEEALTPNSANKDFNHVRGVLQTVNDNLRFNMPIIQLLTRINIKDTQKSSRLSFTPEFVQDTLLNSQAMEGLNETLTLFIGAMADTGARISELTGLDANAGDIVLDAPIPYIHIRPNNIRRLKTPDSKRIIPLVGSALYAFKQLPQGFTQYQAHPDNVSNAIGKWFRENEILPTRDHTLYSLRHCFQDRLIAIEAPERVQAELMGHKFHRPKYGAGASLEQKELWLNKIAFKVSSR